MIESLIWFAGSVAIGAVGVWWARSFAIRQHWLDRPNERSFHENPTPRIGGVGVLLPLVLTLVFVSLIPGHILGIEWVIAVVPALLVSLLSFFDDRFDLSRALRFGVHIVLAGVVLWLMRDIWVDVPLPLVGDLFPWWLAALFLLIWIVGLTNAYNFMDGIDGIAATQGIIALSGWILLMYVDPSINETFTDPQAWLLLALLGGLCGFLLFNWPPASIFLGDLGSTFLGFFLAVVPLAFAMEGLPLDRGLEAGALMVWPFVLDTTTAFGRRLIRREPVFDAHRSHLYQILAGTFSSRDVGHRFTSLLFGLLALLGMGLFWTSGPVWAKLGVLAGVWVALLAWTYGIRAREEALPPAAKKVASKTFRPVADHASFDLFLSPPEISSREYAYVKDAFDSGYIAPVGPQVDSFEEKLAGYLGLEEIHAVSSGTAAIHLGLRALGVGPGDCVLCPDLTFIASCNPIRYLGAEPVLVDVDPENWAIDLETAREAVHTLRKEGRSVRAMVVVHALGIPAPMQELMDFAHGEGLLVLEDCAGAFGTRIGGNNVGGFGDVAAFSFNGNKVLTTSGGGALYIRDANLRGVARSWANQGKLPGVVGYEHQSLGYNYKLSNISAAIGLAQLETVDQRLEKKARIYRAYVERFVGMEEVRTMPEPVYGRCNYWLSNIGLDSRSQASEVVFALRKARIEASPLWKPMHLQTFNQDLRYFGGDTSTLIHRRFLSLPSGTGLSAADIDRVAGIVRSHLPIVNG